MWSNIGNPPLFMLSDAAPYIFFTHLIHTTCLAHGINRVAEEVRNQFPLVNELISIVKKIFVKALLRVQFYKETLPNLPLPPQPVITRWGTWLKAAIFYSDNYIDVKNLILQIADDSNCIKEAKTLFSNPILPNNLAYISANFSIIGDTILKSKEMLLTDSVNLVNKLYEKLSIVNGFAGNTVFEKI
jgi:hypothetical protein